MRRGNELDQTAVDYFLVKVVNGAVPLAVDGGVFDGPRYFPYELDGEDYLLSEIGLLDPARVLPERSDRAPDAGTAEL